MIIPQPIVERIADLERQKGDTKRTAPPEFVDSSFPWQARYLMATAHLLVVLCTRRAGKSFAAALRLLRAAYETPGCSCLFIALTRESAKKIIWKDVLKVINRTHRLGIRFNETDLTATLPNGSVIYALGVDTDEAERDKLLGQKYREVVIDEGASYSIDLTALVYGILKPAVADYRGTISIIGTPGNLKKGIFFDLTQGHDPNTPHEWTTVGWAGFAWSAVDNPHMREKWLAEIAELKAANPRIEETPLFQQHYLGRWVIDESKLVYRYQAGRNDFDGVLPVLNGSWRYILGVDLGSVDPTSFTKKAYHPLDRTLYFLRSWKKSGMDITDVANAIKAEAALVPGGFDAVVIDNANKQAVDEINRRHGIATIAADKTGKCDFIDIMNAEFIQGRIKLGPDCQALKDEYAGLIWDERALLKGRREEHPNCANHCADGGLYGWRWAYQYLSVETGPEAAYHSAEWFRRQAEAQQEAHIEGLLKKNRDRQAEREAELDGLFGGDDG